jgi:hypothetical protein
MRCLTVPKSLLRSRLLCSNKLEPEELFYIEKVDTRFSYAWFS